MVPARRSGEGDGVSVLIIVSRIVLALLGGLGAYQVGSALPLDSWFSSPWRYAAWAAITVCGALVGFLLGGLFGGWLRSRLRAIDRAADRRSAAEPMVGAPGLVVGPVAAALAGAAGAQLPITGPYLLLPAAPAAASSTASSSSIRKSTGLPIPSSTSSSPVPTTPC